MILSWAELFVNLLLLTTLSFGEMCWTVKFNGVCRLDVLSDTNADEIHRGHKRRCRGNELGKVYGGQVHGK